MNNTKIGTVYAVWSKLAPNVLYIGSTTQKIKSRIHNHVFRYTKKDKSGTTISKIFNKYGIETCKYKILKTIPCTDRFELDKLETEIINANKDKCVNKILPITLHNPNKLSKAYINKHKIINCLCGSKVKKQNYRDHINTKKHKDDDSNFLTESLNYFHNNVSKHT